MNRRKSTGPTQMNFFFIRPQGKAGPALWWCLVGLFFGLAMIPFNVQAQMTSDASSPISGRPESLEGILPADVLARTLLLKNDLEDIRVEMGKPKDKWVGGIASNASPHEVYFQALNLFLKANRLSLELTGSMGVQPAIPSVSEIRPYHIWMMVNESYKRILVVKQELGIPSSNAEKPMDSEVTITLAGGAIVAVNRQINLILERPFTPGDVAHQVDLAIQYTAHLLSRFQGTAPIPKPPPFERGKQPGEAFLRLVDCYERLESVAKLSGVSILHFDRTAMNKAVNHFDFHPSDVYDMATLLVSDLAFLHAKFKDLDSPGRIPYPGGRIFPSHVYQRAGTLHALLVDLEDRVKKDPEWLNR